MELIQSPQNIRVKQWYKLLSKKGRGEFNSYIIEGLKLVEEAIKSQHEIDVILIEQEKEYLTIILNLIKEYSINPEMILVSKAVIDKLTETDSPQGVLAIMKGKTYNLNELLKNTDSSLLLVDEIQDPGNLGTMIRSADAAGFDGIILGHGTVDLYNQKVIRSAMGSIFHLPILQDDLDSAIPFLKESGVSVIGTSPYAEHIYTEINYKERLAILVGNESRGLSDTRMGQVDIMVKIPIVGKAESLNVAMATTVILFERVRQLF